MNMKIAAFAAVAGILFSAATLAAPYGPRAQFPAAPKAAYVQLSKPARVIHLAGPRNTIAVTEGTRDGVTRSRPARVAHLAGPRMTIAMREGTHATATAASDLHTAN